jgi:hypothetical protein
VLKEPCQWNEADLQQLIHQKVDESLELEYKSSDALGASDGQKNEIRGIIYFMQAHLAIGLVA